MPLIVEDGSGLPGADSYISAADATAYHASMANTAWASLTDAQREPLLRRATAYMEQAYRTQWAGTRVNATQALSWPRYDVPLPDVIALGGLRQTVPSDVVPREVRQACAELALRAISRDLAPDIGQAKARTKIGPMEVEYAEGSAPVVRFRAVDNMVSAFFGSSGGLNMKVVRA